MTSESYNYPYRRSYRRRPGNGAYILFGSVLGSAFTGMAMLMVTASATPAPCRMRCVAYNADAPEIELAPQRWQYARASLTDSRQPILVCATGGVK